MILTRTLEEPSWLNGGTVVTACNDIRITPPREGRYTSSTAITALPLYVPQFKQV